MKRKDLFVFSAQETYDPPMTEAQLWEAVGRVLATRRGEQGFDSVKAFATKVHRSPAEGTLRSIEEGRPKSTAGLEKYCQLLGLRLTEVLTSVLPGAGASPDGMRVAKAYDALNATDRETVRRVVKLAQGLDPPSGDGPVIPLKKPARTARAR